LDENGEVVKEWFGRTVTRSDARFAYEEAQHLIENQTAHIPKSVAISGKAYKAPKKVLTAVLKLNELAQKMRAKRMSHGAISFDKVEVKFRLDENNEPLGVYFTQAKEANKL